jgi:hypothetical protein
VKWDSGQESYSSIESIEPIEDGDRPATQSFAEIMADARRGSVTAFLDREIAALEQPK